MSTQMETVPSPTDKLTIQALKQHDKIHPKLHATTGPRNTDLSTKRSTKDSQAPSESSRRVRIPSESGSKQPMKKHAMTVFRLVAATRSWKRYTKKNKLPPIPVRYENTYQLEPNEKSKFSAVKVEAILKDVLESRLKGVRYEAEQCRRHTTELVNLIKSRAKTCHFERYKLVCNVLIMENKGQGSQVVSRGLLNTDTDSFATYTFRNSTLIAVASVHGLYFE